MSWTRKKQNKTRSCKLYMLSYKFLNMLFPPCQEADVPHTLISPLDLIFTPLVDIYSYALFGTT